MSNTAELDLMDIKQASVWASRYLGTEFFSEFDLEGLLK